MTSRCRWLIALSLVGSTLGVLRSQDTLVTVSFALLIWIFAAWCLFYLKISLAWSRLSLERTINERPADKVTLWAGRPATVAVIAKTRRGRFPANCRVQDWLPSNCGPVDGRSDAEHFVPSQQIDLSYCTTVQAAGEACFQGLHFQFSEPSGLFVVERFYDESRRVRCLPNYASGHDCQPTIKRINSLPQHGIHRLGRAGLGSELFDIREYQPGDPPKSIAWKVSARRGKLMTRQYESEVPVRVTLFIDALPAVYLGSAGNRSIDLFGYVGSSIAKSTVASGDLIGCVTIGHSCTRRLAPAAGDRAFYRVLEHIARACDSEPLAKRLPRDELTKRTLHVAKYRFPELFQRNVNLVPFTFWPIVPWRRAAWRERVKLCQVIGLIDSLLPGQVAELIYNDKKFSRCAAAFLQRLAPDQAGLAAAPQEYGSFADEAVQRWLTEFNRSVAHARDNEVFVIVADLIRNPKLLQSLLEVIKPALARHHRVVFVCAKPPLTIHQPIHKEPSRRKEVIEVQQELEALRMAEVLNEQQRVAAIKRQVRKAGAAVAFYDAEDPIGLVLAQAELAGSGRTITGAGRRA